MLLREFNHLGASASCRPPAQVPTQAVHKAGSDICQWKQKACCFLVAVPYRSTQRGGEIEVFGLRKSTLKKQELYNLSMTLRRSMEKWCPAIGIQNINVGSFLNKQPSHLQVTISCGSKYWGPSFIIWSSNICSFLDKQLNHL
ncbi:hypothetical protein BJX63DRAFT_397994 [Aspergillus granulosus]|uniref:Uncharacterized protein n=1 Tax=Aspergillus granulosus TaxID=176169 RepID=A0ABR4H8U6_9EURO